MADLDTVNNNSPSDKSTTPQWHDNQDTLPAWIPLLTRHLRNSSDHSPLIYESATVFDKKTNRQCVASNMHMHKIIFGQTHNVTSCIYNPLIIPSMTPVPAAVAGGPPGPPLPAIDPLRPGMMPEEPCRWSNANATPAQLLTYQISPMPVRSMAGIGLNACALEWRSSTVPTGS